MSAHVKEWATFEGWTLVQLTDTGSGLKITSGYRSGTATIQYEATGWATGDWVLARLAGTRLTATIYCLRFKVATTQGGLAAASWSPYQNGIQSNGAVLFDLKTFTLNNPAWDTGPWVELSVSLFGS